MYHLRIQSWLFILTVLLALGNFGTASAQETSSTGNLVEGNWVYTLSDDGVGTLLWGDGSEKSETVVMIPAELGGYTIATMGNGAQNVLSNNKVEGNFVLLPTSITTISGRAVYDYNDTAGWVFPRTIRSIAENAMLSSQGGVYYVEQGSAAETYVSTVGKTSAYLTEGSYNLFTVSAGENGYIQPNGTYALPIQMLNGGYTKSIQIVADVGYKIASLTVDGEAVDFLNGEARQNVITLPYTFTQNSTGITVTFEVDSEDTRTAETSASAYVAPPVLEDAVAVGAVLPEDLNTYAAVNTGTTAKYTNSVGISTGAYYATNGKFYSMVYNSQQTDEPEYYSQAEVINGVYLSAGLVYGADYDMIRLYNYYEQVTSGPFQGLVVMYTTYLYKEVDPTAINLDDFGMVQVDNSYTNTAALFAQVGADLTLANLIADVYTGFRGPSEAGNFFGMGSAIHIDGGDITTPATNTVNEDTAYVYLINPQVLGTVNSIYSLASAVLEISGGNIFSFSSGGHGPYVSTGGQIFINTANTNLINDDGTINTDTSTLIPTSRPSSDLISMARDADGVMHGEFGEHGDDVTAIVTGDEAGTALATDTGGGMIVANQITGRSYGLRSGGAYSIGFNESWIYIYNSSLVSMLDAGLVSASGGYIYAYNSDISGVMGIKTRAGGNPDSDQTGVYVENSRVSAYYDADEMTNVYDVALPEQWDDSMAEAGMSSNQLNIFLDKANNPSFNEGSLEWWFTDRSLTPGYSGGNRFAVIYVENSSTPVYISKTQLINQNYAEYGTLSEEALSEGETPADNLLISVESGGTGNVYFTDENTETTWDLLGENAETTELTGDFYVGAEATSSDNPNLGSGSNTLNVTFTNSEWTGTVLRGDNTGVVNLTFDADSVWMVTGDAIVSNLTLASADNILADAPITLTVAGTLILNGQAVTDTFTLGNVTYVFDPAAITVVESSPPGGMMPPGGTQPDGMMPPGGTPPDGMMPPGGTPPDGMMPPGEITPEPTAGNS